MQANRKDAEANMGFFGRFEIGGSTQPIWFCAVARKGRWSVKHMLDLAWGITESRLCFLLGS